MYNNRPVQVVSKLDRRLDNLIQAAQTAHLIQPLGECD